MDKDTTGGPEIPVRLEGVPVRGELTTLRPADAGDVERLVAWHADPEVARYWDGETFTRAQMEERLSRADVEAWVVEEGDEPVGYLQVHPDGLDMFLVPAARGRTPIDVPDELEALVDGSSLRSVVEALAEVCRGKAEHVRDAWQDRGLGTALVRRAAEVAAEQGNEELEATTQNMQVVKLLRRAGLRPTAEITGWMLHVRAPLSPVVTRVG